MGSLRAVLKFTVMLLLSAITIPLQSILLLFTKGSASLFLPRLWHQIIVRAFGLKVEVTGKPITDRQVVFVSNHVSYLDIPVIGSVLKASFVAKKEVASWPFFGLLAKLQRTFFIDRARHAIREGTDGLQDRLTNNGNSLIIFPEGTSSDGTEILPFKSSLFSIFADTENETVIQPFTIELTQVDGQKITDQQLRDMYAWHGDMTLMPHFWNFAKSKGAKVTLHFHPPLHVKGTLDRKTLASNCHEIVQQGLSKQVAEAA